MKTAFSLVELSIVLVILGLLTGGILTGQSLIRAAELRSITTDFNRYSTAVYTFRDKYFALPGDMTNATDFWGEAHATPTTCATTASTGTETCNGNGDGDIKNEDSFAGSSEIYRFWQHLANAGMIEGTYTGVNGPGLTYPFDSVPGENVPYSKVSNACFAAHGKYTDTIAGNHFNGDYDNRLIFGIDQTDNTCHGAVLTPAEQWGIDKKIDDGLPGQGRIMSREGSGASSCADSADPATAAYNLSLESIVCDIIGQPGW
jgi:prepilin-type N-terminal cleavage/methylation domain-containing protein